MHVSAPVEEEEEEAYDIRMIEGQTALLCAVVAVWFLAPNHQVQTLFSCTLRLHWKIFLHHAIPFSGKYFQLGSAAFISHFSLTQW